MQKMRVEADLKKSVDNEKSRIVLQFFITLTLAAVIGILYCTYSDGALERAIHQKALAHFYLPIKIKDIFDALIQLSEFDFACCVALVVFSFSFLNYIVSDIIMLLYGLKFGMIIALVSSSNDTIGAFASALFIVLEASVLLTIFVYTCKMAILSLDIKKCIQGSRLKLNKKIIFALTFNTVTAQGTILFINLLHCLMMH